MMRVLLTGLLLSASLMLTGCASVTGVSEGFDKSVNAYNRLLRWHEIDSAGTTYMAADQQESFLRQADLLRKRGLSITDYRILSSRCLPEARTGEAVTEFDYYILPSNRIKTISYRQEWVYLEEGNGWKLKSGLPLFE